MQPPDPILRLVDRFHQQREVYTSSNYNETQVRREFIDPFFKALGWDIDNTCGYAEQYKDVIHEDAIKVGGATRAPDYCFRVGGVRKFFLEAKKPAVVVKDDIGPAYQLRRYAWSAKLPLSILTDFEELAIYDCRHRPRPADKASTDRVNYFTFEEYSDRWEEISGVFSKEAVLKGSFDRYTMETTSKRGTGQVDDEFLKDIESWRDKLAMNIALRNPNLSVDELNFAVQRTIDRIIFLRMCEDRGIEDYGRLLELANASQIYQRLGGLFHQADEKYNSGLFDFKADTLSHTLIIDDKVLKPILGSLYYPQSPYEFSVLPAEILGHVYEQFLGKVIRLTAGHRAKVEEKPEVKKAGGVYYTPVYIVNYIVKQTIGKLIEGKTPQQISKLHFLDPACGSGSFLLGAYQLLLDYHLQWYSEHDPKKQLRKKLPPIYQGPQSEWLLTTAEKKRILLNNIFGVDIDRQAVEVTKLSLLLKVLEGENQESLGQQLKLWHDRALPDLGDNIKCGNSLIGPDYFEEQLLPDAEELRRINPFDWQAEFSEIMSRGGFDAVIGNPPYVRQESLKDQKKYFTTRYEVYHGVADLYAYFIERGVSLLNPGGYFSYIVANKWLRANYGKPLRNWLQKQKINFIIDFGDLPVFAGATTYPCILNVEKRKSEQHLKAAVLQTLQFQDLHDHVQKMQFDVSLKDLDDGGWALVDTRTSTLLTKLRSVGIPLSEFVDEKIYRGVLTGLNKAFVIDRPTRDCLIAEDKKSEELIKPYLEGKDIKRYQGITSRKYIIFVKQGTRIEDYPAIRSHLAKYHSQLAPRPGDWSGGQWKGRSPGNYRWFELQTPVNYFQEFERPKLVLPDISKQGNFTIDYQTGSYCANTAYIICSSDKYLLGLLNSRLITFFYKNLSSSYRGGYLRFILQYMIHIPIHTIDFDNPAEVSQHDKVITLVESMLELNKRLTVATIPADKEQLQRQIYSTDRQIDQLVYELYNLTPEEIEIVENATS